MVLLILLLLPGVAIWWAHSNREDLVEIAVERVGQEAGLPVDVGEVVMEESGQMEFRDVDLGELGHIDYIEIAWDWRDLAARRLKRLRVHGLELQQSELVKLNENKKSGGGNSKIQPFVLEELILGQAVLVLDNLGPGIPPLPVRLGMATPLVFKDLQLGGKTSDPAARKIQRVAIHDLRIYSPYDPLAEVLNFEKIEIAFSWAGIQSQHIDRLTFENPEIFVGEELFWFVDQVKNKGGTREAQTAPPWSIGTFGVLGGRLTVTTFGRPGFTLPLIYETEMSGLVLSNFAETPMKTRLTIPPTSLNYPEYGVRISNMRGELDFSLPPGEAKAENIVNTVYLDSISWKGVTATNAWVSITFDENGIYGQLGGESYGGYSSGNFSIMVNEGMRWTADASVSDTEVEPVASKLAPEHVAFKGAVSGDLVVEGVQKKISQVTGNLRWEESGSLEVVAIEELLGRLPEDWGATKRDLAVTALEAFQHYDYFSGRCDFSYQPPESFLDLRFDGKQGKREFNIKWHDLRENPGFGWGR